MRRINAASSAPPEIQALANDINLALTEAAALIAGPARFSLAQLPGAKQIAAGAPRLAFVPDEAGGPTLAFWDGAAWRRTSDNAVCA